MGQVAWQLLPRPPPPVQQTWPPVQLVDPVHGGTTHVVKPARFPVHVCPVEQSVSVRQICASAGEHALSQNELATPPPPNPPPPISPPSPGSKQQILPGQLIDPMQAITMPPAAQALSSLTQVWLARAGPLPPSGGMIVVQQTCVPVQ